MLAALDRELSAKELLIRQQAIQLEEQKAEIAKFSAERDLAFQLAFRKRPSGICPTRNSSFSTSAIRPRSSTQLKESPMRPRSRSRATAVTNGRIVSHEMNTFRLTFPGMK